jgi:hypothetical protein
MQGMPTIEQKVHDLAYKLARLGRYVGPDARPTVLKAKGKVFLVGRQGPVWVCDPQSATSWRWWHQDEGSYGAEFTLGLLMGFENTLTALAMERARAEAVETLAGRIVARVAKPKTRGFKADLRAKSARRSRPETQG